MTRLKSEWLAQVYTTEGVPLRARLFGHIRLVNRLGSALAPLANRALGLPGANWLGERLLGISRRRSLPHFAGESFHQWFERRQAEIADCKLQIDSSHSQYTIDNLQLSRTVVLFPDTFTDYNEPAIGRAAVRVLEAAGYEVILPRRPVCCGRPLISKGLLPAAQALAREQLEWLAPYAEAGFPIVGLEPSCILTFRDELPDLVDDPRAQVLAQKTFLFDEFLAQEVKAGRAALSFKRSNVGTLERSNAYLLHGHCHQKALAGTAGALALLRMIPGAEVREVDSGCCGMAGSFGYEAEHYDISLRMGERALFPAVRALPEAAEVVAMGTSCRHQIADGTGRRARHLAEVLADALEQ
jgi:Fe-S oxidoreductase